MQNASQKQFRALVRLRISRSSRTSNESPKSLPLDKAYEFAKEHNFEAQAQTIQNFKFDDNVSAKQARRIRKGMLIQLFERREIYSDFVNKY
jgi:hypothetical protein